jgi:hypothetical protein
MFYLCQVVRLTSFVLTFFFVQGDDLPPGELLKQAAASEADTTLTTVAEQGPGQVSKEPLPLVQVGEPSSSRPEMTFEERLKLLLEPEQHQESIEIAKSFLGNLGTANFEDPAVILKIREYASFLQKHLVGEELAIANALMLKMELLPPLQANARQLEEVIQKKQADKAAEEAKADELREKLRERRTYLIKCDTKLAELEVLKAEIEKKIASWRTSRALYSERLVQEISIAEGLKRTINDSQADIKKTTFESEDRILEYHRALLDIASLGRRL